EGLASVQTTADAGVTWKDVSPTVNYQGSQGFFDSTIAIDPANSNIVYVGGATDGTTNAARDFLNSVLQTTDGGATWTDITNGSDGNGVHVDHHAMTFDAAGRLLDGNDGGVWRLASATPGSIQWTDINSNLSTIQFIGVATHPTDPNVAYGGSQDN